MGLMGTPGANHSYYIRACTFDTRDYYLGIFLRVWASYERYCIQPGQVAYNIFKGSFVHAQITMKQSVVSRNMIKFNEIFKCNSYIPFGSSVVTAMPKLDILLLRPKNKQFLTTFQLRITYKTNAYQSAVSFRHRQLLL